MNAQNLETRIAEVRAAFSGIASRPGSLHFDRRGWNPELVELQQTFGGKTWERISDASSISSIVSLVWRRTR